MKVERFVNVNYQILTTLIIIYAHENKGISIESMLLTFIIIFPAVICFLFIFKRVLDKPAHKIEKILRNHYDFTAAKTAYSEISIDQVLKEPGLSTRLKIYYIREVGITLKSMGIVQKINTDGKICCLMPPLKN